MENERETRDLIRRYFEAADRADHDAMLALVGEDVVFDPNQEERRIGRETLRWHLGLRSRHFRDRYEDVQVFIAPGGSRAAAELTLKGTYVATAEGLPEAHGQSYSLRIGYFFDVDDGGLTRVSEHYNRAELVAQLGRG